jgi:hypothetical protein
MRLKLDSAVEWAYVFLFAVFLAYIGMAAAMDHRLKHTFPYGFSASDAFGEIAYTEGIQELGSYKFLPFYLRAGFSDTLGFHMPISNHIFALFSFASGLEVWDSLLVTGFLYSIFAVLAMYLLVRGFSRSIALISISLAVFLYIRNFSVIYSWGQWDLVMATFFMISAAWVLSRFELKYGYMLFAVLASGIALTHITEAAFLFMFTALFFIIRIARKKSSFAEIKKLAAGGVIATAICFYYLMIFKLGYAAGGVDNTIGYHAPEWFDAALGQFGFVQFLIIGGLIVSLFLLFTGTESTALVFGVFMLLIGYTNFISSFAPRAFQTRYLWPVHLSALIGVLIYFLLKLVIKEWKTIYSILIGIILASSITYAYYEKNSGSGIMDQRHWDMLMWIRENTPKDAKIIYFYGDPYSQEAILWNQKRLSYRVSMEDFANAAKERKIKREYVVNVAAADDAELLYRKSLFSFGYHYNEVNMSEYFGKKSICYFDYFVLDRGGMQQALAQYNLLIANELVKNGAIAVFDNGVLVLKKIKVDCIEERDF